MTREAASLIINEQLPLWPARTFVCVGLKYISSGQMWLKIHFSLEVKVTINTCVSAGQM